MECFADLISHVSASINRVRWEQHGHWRCSYDPLTWDKTLTCQRILEKWIISQNLIIPILITIQRNGTGRRAQQDGRTVISVTAGGAFLRGEGTSLISVDEAQYILRTLLAEIADS